MKLVTGVTGVERPARNIAPLCLPPSRLQNSLYVSVIESVLVISLMLRTITIYVLTFAESIVRIDLSRDC